MPSAGQIKYQSEYPQQHENFERDGNLTDYAASFRHHLDSFSPRDNFESHCKEFFDSAGNQLLGPVVSLAPDEQLGTVRDKAAFLEYLRVLMIQSGVDMHIDDVELMVRSWLGM